MFELHSFHVIESINCVHTARFESFPNKYDIAGELVLLLLTNNK